MTIRRMDGRQFLRQVERPILGGGNSEMAAARRELKEKKRRRRKKGIDKKTEGQ